MIPYGRQNISADDIDAVVEVLRSDLITQGPAVPAFENAVAQKCGAQYGVATNSATSALHIACLAAGLGGGDWLWTTPISFVASANCGLYCGASVDFVDIDPLTLNMSPKALAEKLAAAKAAGLLPKVVIPVHFTGEPCDMLAIGALAREYGFTVIEDASHGIGGRYGPSPIGSCMHSAMTVFSFHPVKIITTAEGGLVTTNDEQLARRLQLFRSHGITRDPDSMTQADAGAWWYEQIALGYNYRMTDVQAALGLSQLRRLEEFIGRRHEIADRYDRLLSDLPLVLPFRNPDHHSGLHLYVIQIEAAEGRREVFDRLRAQGIGVNVHYIPIHLQPYYRALGFHEGSFPNAEAYYESAISLPMFPDLTTVQQDAVAEALGACL